MKAIELAESSLKSLTKIEINEIREYGLRPPLAVEIVMKMILILKGFKEIN